MSLTVPIKVQICLQTSSTSFDRPKILLWHNPVHRTFVMCRLRILEKECY